MAQIYPFLNEQYKSTDGTFPVVIYIYHKKRRLHATGYKSSKKDWDAENGRVKKTHPNYLEINPTIEGLISKANTYKSNCELHRKPFNVNHVFEEIQEDSSYIKFMLDQADKFEKANRHHTANSYRGAAGELKKWYGRDVAFSDITEKFVADFDANMRDVRGNSVSTRRQKISEYSSVYKVAVNKGIAPQVNHFALHEIEDKETPKLNVSLTGKEIELLAQLEIPKKRLKVARDMYLFSLYCRGMRFINLLYIDKKKDIRENKVYWIPAKQSKIIMSQTIHKKLQEIIDRNQNNSDKYLFFTGKKAVRTEKEMVDNAIYMNKDYNRWLKKVCELAGIEKHVTLHTARHTFASSAFTTTKNLSVTQDLIGHGDIRSTKGYAGRLGIDFLQGVDQEIYQYAD